MPSRDFLRAVLPSTGYYCVAEFSSSVKEHVFVDNIDDMLPVIERFHEAKHDTYFALSAFRTPTDRTAANATTIRAAFLDIEGASDSHYKSKKEVAIAVESFLQATPLGALGTPWIVSSGGGLHFYWPFAQDIPIKVWKPVAENLKRLCKKHGLVIDRKVTADAARVLRVPGTTNWKAKYPKPRPCELKYKGDVFDFAAFAEAVRMPLNGEALHEQEEHDIPGTPPPPGTAMLKLIENSESSFRQILDKGCKQIEHYFTHATDDGMEPLWRGILSVSQLCTDADKAARMLTKAHPYTHERLREKLRGLKGVGPHTCAAFADIVPDVCDTCMHKGNITTPLQLGRVMLTDKIAKPVTITRLASAETVIVQRPEPPEGFYYGKAGGIIADFSYTDGRGKEKKTTIEQKQILPFDLFPLDVLNDQNSHMLHMVAMRPNGDVNVLIPTKFISNKERVIEHLNDQNIATGLGEYGAAAHQYIHACYKKMSLDRPPLIVPNNYGWQDDGTFVFNNRVYTHQKEILVPMPRLNNMHAAARVQGNLSEWKTCFELLIKNKFWDMLAVAMLSFGSPLLYFTTFNGLVFHLGSAKSGTGKSATLELAASVWGDPRMYKTAVNTSSVAMEQHMGNMRSLPLIVDEITVKSAEEFKWFGDFLLAVTGGRGKERMKSATNEERMNTTNWQTLVGMSSNTNSVDNLTSSKRRNSQGELRRVIEVPMNNEINLTTHEEKVYQRLYANFGVAGHKYAQWLVRNKTLAAQITMDTYTNVQKDFITGGQERFWTAGIAACIAGAILAGPRYADIIELPIMAIMDVFKKLVGGMRTVMTGSMKTASDVLNDYIAEQFGNFVIMHKGSTNAQMGDQQVPDAKSTRSRVAGRVEMLSTQNIKRVYIDHRKLKEKCVEMGLGYDDFCIQLRRAYQVAFVEKDLLKSVPGPRHSVKAIRIDMPENDPILNQVPVAATD